MIYVNVNQPKITPLNSLDSLHFFVSLDNLLITFIHVLFAVRLLPSRNGLDKRTWLSPFE